MITGKTIIVSDLHLGNTYSNAKTFKKFLKEINCDRLILNGDIIDMIRFKNKMFWKQSHSKVIQKLIKLSENIEIIYICGNHDYYMKIFSEVNFGKIKICNDYEFKTSSGKKVYVQHGHQYDGVFLSSRFLYVFGDFMYGLTLLTNKIFNKFRSLFNLGYFSLSELLKKSFKKQTKFVLQIEDALIQTAKEKNADVITIGHLHMVENKIIDGIQYINSGCWTENCTDYIIEINGELVNSKFNFDILKA